MAEKEGTTWNRKASGRRQWKASMVGRNPINEKDKTEKLYSPGAKREEIKGTIKQKMARRHSKEGGNHLEQESIRQKTMEGIGWRATSCSG